MNKVKDLIMQIAGGIGNALTRAARPPPQQAMAARRSQEAELFNLRDYASRAVQKLPGHFNLDTDVSVSSLPAGKIIDGSYGIYLYKKSWGQAVTRAEGVRIMQALNTSLSDVRFQTEKNVENERCAIYAAICDLEIRLPMCWRNTQNARVSRSRAPTRCGKPMQAV